MMVLLLFMVWCRLKVRLCCVDEMLVVSSVLCGVVCMVLLMWLVMCSISSSG